MSVGPDEPTLAAQDLPGRGQPPAILGGYRLGQRLGAGGMATVYRAEQMSLGRQVALKVIGPPHTADEGFCERFLREARLAAGVNHPNIITVYDAGQDRGFLYMALELVGGGDAAEATTADGGRLEERRALDVIVDCCHGLIALDHAGLIHRDIKPANVFLTRGPGGERAKLADLGLARKRGDASMTADGSVLGTPAYMAPEQATGDVELDIRTDLYALGATLYALLTGRAPFTGSSAYTVVSKVLQDPAPDPRAVQPAISNATASIVLHCLAKDRDQRYAGPTQLLADLDCARQGLPLVHAPLVGHPSASWDRVTSSGPVPKNVRNRSTLDLQPRDELGVDDGDPVAGKGLWWILGGVAVGLTVFILGALASRSAPQPQRQTAEADLGRLEAGQDPLRPREMLLGPEQLGRTVDEPSSGVRPTPPAPLPRPMADGPDPLPPPVVEALPPVVEPAPPAVVAPTPEPAPPFVAPEPEPAPTPVPPPIVQEPTPPVVAHTEPEPEPAPQVAVTEVVEAPLTAEPPEVDAPAEIPPALTEVAEIPTAPPTPPVQAPTPAPVPAAPDLSVAKASAAARQAALERSGYRCRIEVLADGKLAVSLLDPTISSLTPLVGLPIARLDANGTAISGDLAALTGMPLTDLRLRGCAKLTGLRGLRGTPLTSLDLSDCGSLTGDLAVLRGAKLTHLQLANCKSLSSLDGLQDMPLTELNLSGCASLTGFAGLDGCPLEVLVARDAKKLAGDCRPLAKSRLRRLDLQGCTRLTGLDGLPVAGLTNLNLRDCSTLTSLVPLRGAPLTTLDASGCTALRSLDGLQSMPLTELRLYGCRSLTGDFSPVRGAPLTLVDASYCSQMTSLNGLQDSPLKKLILVRNSGIKDYATVAGIAGLDIQK